MRRIHALLFLPFLFILLFVSFAGATSVGSGSYADALPSGQPGPPTEIHKTGKVNRPLPTSHWWTAAIASTNPYRMFAYPNAYETDPSGLLIGNPDFTETAGTCYDGQDSNAPYRQQLLVQAFSTFTATECDVDGYSDWTAKLKWVDPADATRYFTATIGHGLPFSYFEFSNNISSAQIAFPLNWATGQLDAYDSTGALLLRDTTYYADNVAIKYSDYTSGKTKYFGLYAPQSASFVLLNSGHDLQIFFSIASAHFLSIAPIAGTSDLSTYYNYAYAFVTGSQVSWSVDEAKNKVNTTFTVTTTPIRTDKPQTTTLQALFPHQWKYSNNSYLSQTYQTLRGTMKLIAGNSFQTSYNFNGILPFLPDKGDYDRGTLQSLLNTDKAYNLSASTDTYSHGKDLWKMASLLPIADELGDSASKTSIINTLSNDLANWYTYTPGETYGYFYYDSTLWGTMIGYNPSYGTQNLDDHHFHYGYYIYASAILALYDSDFQSRYGGMVEHLIRDIAAPTRNDTMYPFLRYFDPYEGHSWADGMGKNTDGNNQESSSEAMNAWAGIYLWGLVTGNNTYRDLGIYLYTTEYAGIYEYYFDVAGTTYGNGSSGYNHDSIGILWGGKADYTTYFGSYPEYIRGIQFIPCTPSSLYLGYNPTYCSANYSQMCAEIGGSERYWYDILWQYQAFSDPASAIAKYNSTTSQNLSSNQNSSNKTYLYYFLHNMNALGNVDTSVYTGGVSSFAAFNKNGAKTYVVYNPDASARAVSIYNRSDGSYVGQVIVNGRSMAARDTLLGVTGNNLDNVKVYPNPYQPGSGTKYDDTVFGQGIIFENLTQNARIKIFNVAGELIADISETSGLGRYVWNARNQAGNKVASGVYIYFIVNSDNSSQKAKGKFAIER